MKSDKDIPIIELNDDETYNSFIKNNKTHIYRHTVNALGKLVDSGEETQLVFVLSGKLIDKTKDFVISRDKIDEYLERSLKHLEKVEEYEYCSRIVEIRKKWENNEKN